MIFKENAYYWENKKKFFLHITLKNSFAPLPSPVTRVPHSPRANLRLPKIKMTAVFHASKKLNFPT